MSTYISHELINYSFENDKEINKYCDPIYSDKSIEELCISILYKLIEWEIEIGNCCFDEVVIDGNVIGFIFCCKDMLVSFGINKKYRTKENLKKVFEFIKSKFESDFISYMWDRNTRAINWLKKCGMKEDESKIKNVTKLKYILCQ